MKRTSHSKVVKTGFLILLFLSPSFAKSFHISYEEIVASATPGHSSHHNSDDCPICLFHYSSCVEAEAHELNTILLQTSFEPPFCEEKEYQPFLYSYFLRGPPLSITN